LANAPSSVLSSAFFLSSVHLKGENNEDSDENYCAGRVLFGSGAIRASATKDGSER
jgi:hypothetical protein